MSFTGSQSGIITEDQHQGARILEVRPERVAAALDDARIAIVAGFQGVSKKREITTLGRGGSDTTAVALAAALAADACEIYSDVDGVYSADPNVCPEAQHLPELRYEVMQTMAGAGAKVLNADAVEFARRAGIVIHALKTGDASGRQTRVSTAAPTHEGVVAVVGATTVSLLEGSLQDFGSLAPALAAVGARPMAWTLGAQTLALVDRTGMPGKDDAPVAALAAKAGLTARSCAAVSLVGTGLAGRFELPGAVAAVLAEIGVTCLGWFWSDERLTLAVDVMAHQPVVNALHARFVSSNSGDTLLISQAASIDK
jgi:aspartate kinase